MSLLRQQAEELYRKNLQLRGQLIGTDYMPDLGVDTLDAGPKGFGEGLSNLFGLYDAKPKLEAMIKERESRQARYNQAIKNLEKATRAEVKAEAATTKAETKAEEALETQEVMDRDLELLNRQGEIVSRLQREAGDISLEQSIKQTQALLPYIDQAQARAIERNLSASQRLRHLRNSSPPASKPSWSPSSVSSNLLPMHLQGKQVLSPLNSKLQLDLHNQGLVVMPGVVLPDLN